MMAVALLVGACKTSEANYRAAYEKAKDKGRSDAVEAEVYQQIEREQQPSELTFGSVSFPARYMNLTTADINKENIGKVEKFSVVMASFRQAFNASSMAARLRDMGFEKAFVAIDRDGSYFVVAVSTSESETAAQSLTRALGMPTGARAPFPYVAVSAQ